MDKQHLNVYLANYVYSKRVQKQKICLHPKGYLIQNRITVEHAKHQARPYGGFAPICTVAINVLTFLTLDFSIIAKIP